MCAPIAKVLVVKDTPGTLRCLRLELKEVAQQSMGTNSQGRSYIKHFSVHCHEISLDLASLLRSTGQLREMGIKEGGHTGLWPHRQLPSVG